MTITRILRFFQNQLTTPGPQTPEAAQDAIRTATAAVLLEIAWADDTFAIEEEAALIEYLKKSFDLSDEGARGLLERADELRSGSIDHWDATNVVRKNTTVEQRIEIVKTMWRLVYSDGRLHQYENYLVRKLADLLGIEHKVMIEAKLSVRSES